MFATLAEPAMLVIVFSLALIAGSTQLSTVAAFMARPTVGLRVTLGMALIALVMVALAENGRIPVDNPATHLELTMVHEAMVLEYSGRHLALIELAGDAEAAALRLADRLRVRALGRSRSPTRASATRLVGAGVYVAKLGVAGVALGAVRDQHRQDAGVPRARFPRRGADARAFSARCCCSFRGRLK